MYRPTVHFRISANSNIGKAKNFIAKPNNFVILNFWSPGYKTLLKDETDDGFEYERKVFVSTNTFKAAVAHFRYCDGEKDLFKSKYNVHPGHVSLITASEYLSIGPAEPLPSVGLRSRHEMSFTENFETDCNSFLRMPEEMIVLHSLDAIKVNDMIAELRASKKPYEAFGNRFRSSAEGGESCATSCYKCLQAGGLEELLRVDHKLSGRKTILTAVSMMLYVKTAQANELQFYPQLKDFSKEYDPTSTDEILNIKRKIAETVEDQLEEEIREKRANVGPRP
jgi:hypothetical protein